MRFRRPAPSTISRGLTILAIVLALAGTGVLAYPFATDMWAARIQRSFTGDLAASADAYRRGEIKSGEALTRLEIPRLDVDVIVVEGTSLAALQAGAGH